MKKIIIVLLFYCFYLFFDYKLSIDSSFEMMDKISNSIRNFTSINVKENKLQEDSFPLNVPSHNAISIMREFNSKSMYYREVSLNPTNLNNKANVKQAKNISRIKFTNEDHVYDFDFESLKFEKYIPIYMNDVSCLKCHSDYNLAPKKQIDIYGANNGFNYALGDIYGVKYLSIEGSDFIIKNFIVFIIIMVFYFNGNLFYRKWIFPLFFIDHSTGAYNKNYYLKLSGSNKFYGYLFLIDIDDFKKVNDSFGHDIGDIVIKSVVDRIKSCVRKNDMVFRIGGEEFLLLVESIDRNKAKELALNINNSIASTNINCPIDNLRVSVSIGYCLSTNEDMSISFKKADRSLYKVKSNGKNHSLEG